MFVSQFVLFSCIVIDFPITECVRFLINIQCCCSLRSASPAADASELTPAVLPLSRRLSLPPPLPLPLPPLPSRRELLRGGIRGSFDADEDVDGADDEAFDAFATVDVDRRFRNECMQANMRIMNAAGTVIVSLVSSSMTAFRAINCWVEGY